jgi:hypothetical protein
LLRLEQAGAIRLPPRQRKSPNGYRNRSPLWVPHHSEPIACALKELAPLEITRVENASVGGVENLHLFGGYRR